LRFLIKSFSFRICHTVILDDPFEDIRGLNYPRKSPEPTDEILKSDRIRCDEDINVLDGKTEEEINEILEERETKKRATVLEIIGDIPDAEVKPPDNVLFVCKLNQVTNDEDLELIFSRFGNILSCEVIRDRVTGDSLCYAFIEFENKEDCENAYFKMDNVIIDDRRIHVDFSQSVSKLYWKSRGKDSKPEKYFEEKKPKDEPKHYHRDDNRYKLKSHQEGKKNYEFVFDNNDDKRVDSKYEKYDKKRSSHHDYRKSNRDRDDYNRKRSSSRDYDKKRDRE
jgi:peptidyl-prolyl cis-trans isomerase-like 4